MTPKERTKPDILAASRKRRIASGSGVEVAEVNRLLKQHRQMQDAFKAMSKGGGKGFARMAQMFGGGPGGMGGGMDPSQMPNIPGVSPADMEKARQMLAENGGKLPGLPGLGGKLPGFPFKKP